MLHTRLRSSRSSSLLGTLALLGMSACVFDPAQVPSFDGEEASSGEASSDAASTSGGGEDAETSSTASVTSGASESASDASSGAPELDSGTGDDETDATGEPEDPCAGALQTFASEPGWTAVGLPVGDNDYGWSPSTAHAGGSLGEIGGTFQRSASSTSYFTVIEPQGAKDCIAAGGRLAVTRQDPDFDQGVRFGHLLPESGAFVGFSVNEGTEGAVRIFMHAGGLMTLAFEVDDPAVPRSWSYVYEPSTTTMTLELEGLGSVARVLTDEEAAAIADLQAFGLWTVAIDDESAPGVLELWIDEVVYTP